MSEKQKTFYITTTLPYVNANPHVGFAMEIIRADAVARMKSLEGYEVFFNTGTDEHGSKIYEKAQAAGKDPQSYVDEIATEFQKLQERLNLFADLHFIRTTDSHHEAAAQEMWRRCDANGYIYKKNYQTKYCVGCELEKTDSELEDGRCPIHPTRELDLVDEENYFFKFSAFGEQLLQLYADKPDFVTPDFRLNEIRAFVERGLQDFSISRLKSKMPWGVPVPGDEEHVMYVWFDALTNYVSTLGWPEEGGDFEKFWVNGTPVQYAGKDNLRQQSAMWQAMLLAAGLPTSDRIIINGFINSGGQKMSKSLGNVINPYDILDEYGALTPFPEDVLRYYLLRHMNAFEDSDMTHETLAEAYTANLVNGLGNLVSRLMNMVVNYEVEYDLVDAPMVSLDNFQWDRYMNEVWAHIGKLDEAISDKQPFKKIKENPDEAKADLADMIQELFAIAVILQPVLPRTAESIQELIREKKKPERPLFARKES